MYVSVAYVLYSEKHKTKIQEMETLYKQNLSLMGRWLVYDSFLYIQGLRIGECIEIGLGYWKDKSCLVIYYGKTFIKLKDNGYYVILFCANRMNVISYVVSSLEPNFYFSLCKPALCQLISSVFINSSRKCKLLCMNFA